MWSFFFCFLLGFFWGGGGGGIFSPDIQNRKGFEDFSSPGVDIIMSNFNAPKTNIKHAQNIGCTCSMCEQS